MKALYDPIRAVEDDTYDDESAEAQHEGFVAGISPDGQPDSVGGGSVVQDTQNPTGQDAGPYSPGERQPGGFGSSSPTSAGPQVTPPKAGLFDRFRKKKQPDDVSEPAPKTKERRPKAQTRPGRRNSAAGWRDAGRSNKGQHCRQDAAAASGEGSRSL